MSVIEKTKQNIKNEQKTSTTSPDALFLGLPKKTGPRGSATGLSPDRAGHSQMGPNDVFSWAQDDLLRATKGKTGDPQKQPNRSKGLLK